MKNLKGKVLVGLVSLAVLGGVTVGSVGAFATPATGSGAESDTRVGFRNFTEPPGSGDNELSLQHVPEVMNFGIAHEAGRNATYNGDLNDAEHAMLRDDRSDPTKTKWSLSAKASRLTATDNSSIITAGKITMESNGNIKEWAPSDIDATIPTLIGDYTTQPTMTRNAIELPLDGTTTDTLANTDDTGTRGYYALPLENVKMSVTSDATHAGKQFSGNVTWTLDDLE